MLRQQILTATCGTLVIVIAALVAHAQSGEAPKKVGGNVDQWVAQRFRQLDKNNDERLTPQELGVGLFQQLNSNGDEYVTLDEAQSVIRAKGLDAVMKAAGQVKNGAAASDAKPAGSAEPNSPALKASTENGTAEPSTSTAESPIRQGPRRVVAGDFGIGRMIPNLRMTDVAGKSHQLADFADRRAVVVAFTNTTCPLCKKYAPSLAALEKKFAGQDVAFIYVNPTPTDKTETIQAAINLLGLTGLYVRDADGSLARALGATHTTDVFLLDAKRTLIYRGAIDDQYGFGYSLDSPRVEYLDTALRALLENRPLLISATEAPGCPLDLAPIAGDDPASGVTYHNRISRILQSHCVACHRDGSVAPFALDSYESVVAQSGTIRQAVEREIMPPWFAARPEPGKPSHWANDQSLSDREKSDLLGWLSHGKPAGDPADAPIPKSFPEGWRIGTPNLIVQLPMPMPVKATGVMPYQDVIVETGLTEDKWVRSMEIRPTAKEVVHHVLVFLLPPARKAGSTEGSGGDDGDRESDGFFAAYAPGHEGLIFANDFGKFLPAGSRLKFQLHYTPNGTAAEDQTKLGIVFSEQKPKHLVHVTGIANTRLSIPPGAENHPETATRTLPFDTTILAFFPHMHLRGKAFRYEARLPDGRTQVLLDVPRYDFNWQLSYRLAEPIELPRGTTLHLTGWFDNSKNNPANPDPTRTVGWGPQTYDEMMLGYVEYHATDGNETMGRGAVGAGGGALLKSLEAIFQKLDRDQDGKLSGDEFPAEWKTRILKLDTDNDGAVSLEEVRRATRNRPGRSGT
jgi:peroxiredoxin